MLSPWGRVRRGRATLSRRTWALLEQAFKNAGIPWSSSRVVQGSWHGSVKASAGTHNGAGAFDLSVRGLTLGQQLDLLLELRKLSTASWIRNRKYGWYSTGPHIHGIVKDEPGLSYGARRQVVNYNQGLNGLASRRRDPFPRPKQVPFKFGSGGWTQVPASVAVVLRNLRYGKRNDDVKDLQRALGITADGVYGPKTDAAVRAHQKKMGLTPDPKGHSYIGPKQARALKLKVIS